MTAPSRLEDMRKQLDQARRANERASARLERLRKVARELDAEIEEASRDEREARAHLGNLRDIVDLICSGSA